METERETQKEAATQTTALVTTPTTPGTGDPPPTVATTTVPAPTPAPAPAPEPAKELTTETKIVITHRDEESVVGMQKTGVDARFFKCTGDLLVAFAALPGFFTQAEESWKTNPRYPAAPKPKPKTSPATTSTSAGKSTTVSVPTKPKLQNSMFDL